MIPEKIQTLLNESLRPAARSEYDVEIENAKKNGCHVPDIDLDSLLVTQQQASRAMESLRIPDKSTFYKLMQLYRDFPLGKGEELYNLSLIVEENTAGSRYLRFTSIEGEGSYFYDVETDAVYDVNWGEEELMESGQKEPWFTSFSDFLEWYYSGGV